jgi:uridine phosphorylase
MNQPYPILEHDPARTAMIEPHFLNKPINVPQHCVITFFHEVISAVCGRKGELAANVEIAHELGSELGKNPVYVAEKDGGRFAVIHPGVGAPLAAAFLEEMIALGCRKFIACGSAGVLNADLAVGHVVIPTSAVRDEGTSYHYLPPGREVACSAAGVEAIRATLEHHHLPYVMGKTWTTDAIYRETPAKVALRRAEGCLTVEMEAAAFFAVAQFRGVTFAQILYSGDTLGGDEWDMRDFLNQRSTREKLFWLAAEACLRL